MTVKDAAVRSMGRSRYRREEQAGSGRRVASRPWPGKGKIDPVATLYAAWRSGNRAPGPSDLKAPVHRAPQPCLHIFVLDVSDSMSATIAVMRRWLNGILKETYVRRDPMMIITVQGTMAKILAAPTTSIHFLLHRLAAVVEGGATPLRQGIQTMAKAVRQWHDRYPAMDCIVVSDGRSTEPLDSMEVKKSLSLVHRFARNLTVVNPVPRAASFARAFAEFLGARYLEPG